MLLKELKFYEILNFVYFVTSVLFLKLDYVYSKLVFNWKNNNLLSFQKLNATTKI